MAAAGDEDDFDTGGVGLAESYKIAFSDLKLWVEQGAVDIGGDKADGSGLCGLGFGTWIQSDLLHFFIVAYLSGG